MATCLVVHDALKEIKEKESVKCVDLYWNKMKKKGRSIFAWIMMIVTSELILKTLF